MIQLTSSFQPQAFCIASRVTPIGSMTIVKQTFRAHYATLEPQQLRGQAMNRLRENEDYEIDFPSVNRVAVLVKVKQPYIDWMDNLPDGSELIISAAKLNEKPYVLLLPIDENRPSVQKVLQKAKLKIFEQQLNAWCTDIDWWPKNRSVILFDQWFEIQIATTVFDLPEDEPLGYEEY